MRASATLLSIAWLVVAAAGGPAGAQPIEVAIVSPDPGVPVFGIVELRAEIYTRGTVARLELSVDGQPVSELTEPPWSTEVDLGDENREHLFAARATGIDGEIGIAELRTPALQIDQVVDAELQQLYVTVADRRGRVLDLEERHFEVLDNGARQTIATFARGDVRITATLLVDASASMVGERLRSALRGALTFVGGMSREDDASIMVFSDRLLHSTPFSNDPQALTPELVGIEATGGTALNDTLYLALKRLEQQQGRRVVVLLSDGIDSHSVLRMADVQWLAQRSRALVYWIRLDVPDGEQKRFSAWKTPAEYRSEYALLGETVVESGGRVVTLATVADAQRAFGEILAELREQYVLGYHPNNMRNDESFHRVIVRVRRADLVVRTREGYIDY